MPERSTMVLDNLNQRHNGIAARLGQLAYRRRDLQIQIERIDEEVAQLEGQAAIIEATLKDVQQEGAINEAAKAKEQADAKEERSQRAKTAAQKRKRETAKEAPREKA
jgi:hypothetical protein